MTSIANFPKRVFYGFLLMVILFPAGSYCSIHSNNAVEWKMLETGLSVAEINGPHVSKFSDSKVTILKIDPAYFEFEMVVSAENDSVLRTAREWCEMKNLTGGVNAGMYSLVDHLSSIGYMQNNGHVSKPEWKADYNALAVFNPKDLSLPAFQIIDMRNQDWKSVLPYYQCGFQSIRMIDNNGNAVYWKNKHTLRCSMTVLAVDKKGNVLFVFSRSPYGVNEMIDLLKRSSLDVQTAMYLEGGPESTLYVKASDTEIIRFGSYVSGSNPNDDNAELRKMPNMLGFRKKVNDQH